MYGASALGIKLGGVPELLPTPMVSVHQEQPHGLPMPGTPEQTLNAAALKQQPEQAEHMVAVVAAAQSGAVFRSSWHG